MSSIFSTKNKAANTADWFPGVSFFSGFYHIGEGCKQLCALKSKKTEVVAKNILPLSQTSSIPFKDRKAAKEEALRHIRRGLLALLLPVIGSIFLMIYDLINKRKTVPLLPLMPETTAIPQEVPKPTFTPPKIEPAIEVEKPKKNSNLYSEISVEGYEAAVDDPTKVAECLSCLKSGTFDKKAFIEKFKPVADKMSVEQIAAYAKMETNCFHVASEAEAHDGIDQLEALLSGFKTLQAKVFITTTLSRADMNLKDFVRIALAIQRLPLEKDQKNELYLCLFDGISTKGSQPLLGLNGYDDHKGEEGPFRTAIREAYAAKIMKCLQSENPYKEYLNFRNLLEGSAFGEVAKTIPPEQKDKFDFFCEKCLAPHLTDLEIKAKLALQDPIKLKKMYDDVKTVLAMKRLCDVLQPEHLKLCADAKSDPLGLHALVKSGKDLKKTITFFFNLNPNQKRTDLFAELGAEWAKQLFEKKDDGASVFSKILAEYQAKGKVEFIDIFKFCLAFSFPDYDDAIANAP